MEFIYGMLFFMWLESLSAMIYLGETDRRSHNQTVSGYYWDQYVGGDGSIAKILFAGCLVLLVVLAPYILARSVWQGEVALRLVND